MADLTKNQRNEIFRALVVGGIDPAECVFYHDKSLGGAIEHSPSRSTISIPSSFVSGRRVIFPGNYKVGNDPRRQSDISGEFAEFVAQVSKWAADVRKWVDTPDLWELSQSGDGLILGELAPDSANTPFTPEEQTEVSAQLKEIAESVKKAYKLTAEQSVEIDKKFEEAEKASRRMGRKDWGLLFGGAVFSLILTDAITPGIAGHILMTVGHGLGSLFMGAPPSVRGILSAGQD